MKVVVRKDMCKRMFYRSIAHSCKTKQNRTPSESLPIGEWLNDDNMSIPQKLCSHEEGSIGAIPGDMGEFHEVL